MSDSQRQQPGTHIAFSFPAAVDSIGEVRHLVVAEARILPFTPDDLDDIALAVSEAFTNIVEHAHGYRIRGTCDVYPDRLIITFEVQKGIAQYLERRQFPSGLSHGGRGIPLLNLLIPTIEFQETGDGKAELRLVKPVQHEGRARENHSGC